MRTEGFVPFRGHRTWYEVHGDLDAGTPPLVALHGGPGAPHDYLGDLALLADDGIPVVFYDQLGCGASDRPDDDALWIFDTFVDELVALRRHLGLDRLHLLGHSWGGWLALESVLRPEFQQGLVSLILASTCPSMPKFGIMTRALKALLPIDVQETLDRHEAAGTTASEDYQAASWAYFSRFVIRRDPLPDHVARSFGALNERIYQLMQGPEWNVTGNIRHWDVTDRLDEIRVPTLVTSGRYDEMTPALVAPMVEGIPGADWVMFEHSAHVAMAEEPERYRQVAGDFIRRTTAAARGATAGAAPGPGRPGA